MKARHRVNGAGQHYLSENKKIPLNNGFIFNVTEIVKAVMSSAAEAELGALFINSKKAVEM